MRETRKKHLLCMNGHGTSVGNATAVLGKRQAVGAYPKGSGAQMPSTEWQGVLAVDRSRDRTEGI